MDVRSLITWRGAALARARLPRDSSLSAHAAEMRENRRLPETSQRGAFTCGLRCAYTRRIELDHAGLFAGAACFHAFLQHLR